MADKKTAITLVYRELTPEEAQERLAVALADDKCRAMARFDAIDAKDTLEEFVRQLARGDVAEPADAARDLMDRMGWA
ncbi:hypothetical protein D3C78_1455750 [compost metagenome]